MATIAIGVAIIAALASSSSSLHLRNDETAQYYCGRRTFIETEVSVSKDAKFVTDMTVDPQLQNVSVRMDPNSFKLDVTGCMVPKGLIIDAVAVEIEHEDVPKIHTGAVQGLKRLKMIRIERCGVQEVLRSAFFALPSLETISLRFNGIERVVEGVFNNLNVTKLYLNNNSIGYVEEGAFDNMPKLKAIELDGNKLRSWYSDWFGHSPNVEHLSLDSNQLAVLPANSFSRLRNDYSTTIRVSNNRIIYVHPTAFRGLDRLHGLWLDNNRLKKLDDDVFSHLDNLHVLSLAGNGLRCLSDELLYGMRSPDLILRVEGNGQMDCECLRRIESWANSRDYYFTEKYVQDECKRKIESNAIGNVH